MKSSRTYLLSLILLMFGLAMTGIAPAATLDKDDVEFMQKAAVAGRFEIQSSELAKTRGTHADIKAFAEMMIRDHGKMATELSALAHRKAVTLPSVLDDDHAEKFEDLSQESNGEDFDDKYAELMKDGHDDAVDLFEDAAEDAKDSDVRALAQKSLPTLKMHKDHAEKLEDRGE